MSAIDQSPEPLPATGPNEIRQDAGFYRLEAGSTHFKTRNNIWEARRLALAKGLRLCDKCRVENRIQLDVRV